MLISLYSSTSYSNLCLDFYLLKTGSTCKQKSDIMAQTFKGSCDCGQTTWEAKMEKDQQAHVLCTRPSGLLVHYGFESFNS